ncbi:hypothetical protein BP5796_06951 [Coleophoma crateriformis]|uniref:Structure-specific endonuclease subunit SLX4 n=1 Tax=Coleophoma crateriformis TaxID=565419 RepID=A0A3D8RQ82_9HELO|nr:hypothetical protein BP5796_06951 [Coleophoma crateriformis]
MPLAPLSSPSAVTRRRPPILRTGSSAAPTPKDAVGFTSAASLLSKHLAERMDSSGSITAETAEDESGSKSTKLKRVPRSVTAKLMQHGCGELVEEDPLPIIDDTAAKVARRPSTKKVAGHGALSKDKAVSKPRTKKTEGVAVTTKEKAPRIPRDKKGDATVAAVQNEKPLRKPRAKKTDEDSQLKLKGGRVTKASSNGNPTKASLGRVTKSDKVSKHFPKAPAATDESLHLEAAVMRRTEWTPPGPTKNYLTAWVTTPVPIDREDSEIISDGSAASGENLKKVGSLLSTFGFTSNSSPAAKKSIEGAGTRKRKLIELVSVKHAVADAMLAEQPRAVKKKPRTITEVATAAYDMSKVDDATAHHPAPLLQYFSLDGSSSNDGYKVPTKPRNSSPDKPGKRKMKGAKLPEVILLSPESALKQANKQDYVFGTSSQLAREESPTFLRELHQALQESNKVTDDPFSDPLEDVIRESAAISAANSRRSVLPLVTKRNLWSAASRDEDGKILEIETVDLSQTPAFEEAVEHSNAIGTEIPFRSCEKSDTATIQQRARSLQPAQTATSTELDPELPYAATTSNGGNTFENTTITLSDPADGEVWHDLTDTSPAEQPLVRESDAIGPIEAAIRLELRSPAKPKSHQSPCPAKIAIPTKKTGTAPKAKGTVMPDYNAYTDARLAKEIASYHFKPIKKRDVMIDLLKQCWEGKQRLALESLATNTKLRTSAAISQKSTTNPTSQTSPIAVSPPKKPRGRPRKDKTVLVKASPTKQKSRGQPKASRAAENLDFDSDAPLFQLRTPKKPQKNSQRIDEIYDSDPALTPSPPRRPASQIRTPPIPLQVSVSTSADDTPVLSPASSQTLLNTYISKAVKAAPPSNDAKRPSWHEKILVYDPIVLEDLTVWLNTGALERVGWDGEVAPNEVKEWCRSKSICCLWKETLRGETRSRY